MSLTHSAKFYGLNPNYLLVSGNKAVIVRVRTDTESYVVLADSNTEQIPQQDSQHKEQ